MPQHADKSMNAANFMTRIAYRLRAIGSRGRPSTENMPMIRKYAAIHDRITRSANGKFWTPLDFFEWYQRQNATALCGHTTHVIPAPPTIAAAKIGAGAIDISILPLLLRPPEPPSPPR